MTFVTLPIKARSRPLLPSQTHVGRVFYSTPAGSNARDVNSREPSEPGHDPSDDELAVHRDLKAALDERGTVIDREEAKGDGRIGCQNARNEYDFASRDPQHQGPPDNQLHDRVTSASHQKHRDLLYVPNYCKSLVVHFDAQVASPFICGLPYPFKLKHLVSWRPSLN